MNKLWKKTCVFFIFCAAMAVAAPAQTFDSLLSFDANDGAQPFYGSLVQATDGNFYGTTWGGGDFGCANHLTGCGTVFRITPDGTLTRVHIFCTETGCADGEYPYGGLVLGTDRSLYGTTSAGGVNGLGTVFKLTPSGRLITLHSFDGSDGAEPYGTLIQAADGNFYGTTYQGGGVNNGGTIFRITASGTLTMLYSFCSQPSCADGYWPIAGLVEGTDENFYGTTLEGGLKNKNDGTIFKITPAGMLTTLHSFDGHDGGYPYGGLVQGGESLYGTTGNDGPNGGGTIFKVTAHGGFSTVYGFGTENTYPYDGLIEATDGNLYGTTRKGGGGGSLGTVFSLASGVVLSTLHTFDGADGANPFSGLVQSTTGNFYGTTRIGGADNYGTVFSLSMGLGPFVKLVSASGKVGQTEGILGQGFTGASNVSFNGTAATFTVVSDTYVTATVPAGATTGLVTVTTPGGVLTSNGPFRVRP
jgi:uncharacterized repeat protein (TIGR03803 family)